MIFLTIGSWYKGFDRLVRAIDRLKDSKCISEEVIAQIGRGKYKPKNFHSMDFYSPDEFANILTKARIIIAHAGMGTIIQAVKLSKTVIVVPRKAALGEHFDNHQLITAKQLEAEGRVLVAYEIVELPKKLMEAKDFVPVQNKNVGVEQILKAVHEFIINLARY